MFNFLAASQMDERTKKFLLVLFALFVILLLIFGSIYLLISKYMKREAKKMDTYMIDLVRAKIVTTPHEFRVACRYFERRSLFNNAKWPFRIIILVLIALLVVCLGFPAIGINLKEVFTRFFTIFPIPKWQTVKIYNEQLAEILGGTDSAAYLTAKLPGIGWLPVSLIPSFISQNPVFDLQMYISIGFYVIAIICVFGITRAILGKVARTRRAKVKSVDVFQKSLDKFDITSIDD